MIMGLVDILEIPDDIGYWLVRADGGKYYEDFLINNFIAVSDNEITLENIKKISDGSIAGITIEHYKTLYSETYDKWTTQQIAHAASRTQKFIDEMNIGDLILVPSKKSAYFLIGIITSDVYELSEKDVQTNLDVNYAINPFFKRRNVQWLKEVKRQEISEKLYWILSAHQTIFNLSDQRDYINQLLAPIYIQNGICHGSIKISTNEGLNSKDWYDLYTIINSKSEVSKKDVIIKSNVQSPGLLEFVSIDPWTVISITFALSGALFGEINIAGIKLKGILPYYQSYKKEKIEIKRKNKELEIMEEEKITKQLENEKIKFEFEKDKEIWEIKRLENEVERLRLKLQISSFDAGKVFERQTQKDNLDDPNADKP